MICHMALLPFLKPSGVPGPQQRPVGREERLTRVPDGPPCPQRYGLMEV